MCGSVVEQEVEELPPLPSDGIPKELCQQVELPEEEIGNGGRA
jgi:hypothetical protein